MVERKGYPYIFVPGMAGWGEESSLNRVLPYWGFMNFNILKILRARGYSIRTAAVNSLGSTWDHACELYAQLVGGRVDYGKVHSEKYGHARYGVTYEKPLFEGLGQPDKNGRIRKVNLVSHSFGGTGLRFLAYILKNGSEEEREGTTDGTLSPLFEGGHEGLIFSITTLTAPHNGTELQKALQVPLSYGLMVAYYTLSCASSLPIMGHFYNAQLAHFGIGKSEQLQHPTLIKNIRNTVSLARSEDNVFNEISVDGTLRFNKTSMIQDDIYYFSLPACGTSENAKGNHKHDKEMLILTRIFANRLGKYNQVTKDGFLVGDDWKANDGIVPTISEFAPFDEPSTPFDPNHIEKGVWNVLPTVMLDHGAVIGWGKKASEVMPIYCKHFSCLEKLTVEENKKGNSYA